MKEDKMSNLSGVCPQCGHPLEWLQCDRCRGTGDDPDGHSGEYPCLTCEGVGDHRGCTQCGYIPLTEQQFWGAEGYRYGASIGMQVNSSAEDVFEYATDRRGDLNTAYASTTDKQKARRLFVSGFRAVINDYERFGKTF